MKIDEDLEESESKRYVEVGESKNRSCTRTGDANQLARTDPEDRPEPDEDQPPPRPGTRRRRLSRKSTRCGGGRGVDQRSNP